MILSQPAATMAAMGYGGKITEQVEARRLRALGWRLSDIASHLGVAKGSVSVWVRDVEVPEIERRASIDRRPSRLHLERLAAEEDARRWAAAELAGPLSSQAFFAAGVALYAGEGAKSGATVDFVNGDPRIVRFYVAWLRRFFPIEEPRLHARLQLHTDLDLAAATAFWSHATGIPVERFRAPHRPPSAAARKRNRYENGIVTVRYCSSGVLRMVLAAVDCLLTSSGLPG